MSSYLVLTTPEKGVESPGPCQPTPYTCC